MNRYVMNDLRSFRHFRGTRVVVFEGTGEDEDPFREVTYWFDEEGDLIYRNDSYSEKGDVA